MKLHLFCKWDKNHPKYPDVLVCKLCGNTKVKVGQYYSIADDGVGRGVPIYEDGYNKRWLI